MRLQDFIKTVGDATAAKLFGVKERTAMSWRLGDRRPRPAKAAEIVRMTKGKVGFTDIYP
jgi:DNA-binding transcriptional regulator YdaS (Cro superfamily)